MSFIFLKLRIRIKQKKESHWTNVILTDSTYPIATKYFAYSLINDQGKLLEFKQGEDKIPALNFSIQIIS